MGTQFVLLQARIPNLGVKELEGALVAKDLTFGELQQLAKDDAEACVSFAYGREERGSALSLVAEAGLPGKGRGDWLRRLRSVARLAESLDGEASVFVVEERTDGVLFDVEGERPLKPSERRGLELSLKRVRDEMAERARPRTPRIPEPSDAPPKALAAAVEALRGPDEGKAAAAKTLLASDWRPGWQLVAAQLDRDHFVGGPIGQQAIAALFQQGSDVAWDALSSVLERFLVKSAPLLIQTMWAFEWLRSAPEGYVVDPRWIAMAERILRERPNETLRGEHKLFLARFAPKKKTAASTKPKAALKGRVSRR